MLNMRINETKMQQPTTTTTTTNDTTGDVEFQGIRATPSVSSDEEDVDECVAPQSPCGRGAVCQNTVGSFKCICAYDMTALGPHEDCRPTRTFSENNLNNGIGVFKTEDLYDIVKPIQVTETAVTLKPFTVNASNVRDGVHSTIASSSVKPEHALPILVGVTAAGLLLAVFVISLVLCLLRRRRCHQRAISAAPAPAVSSSTNAMDDAHSDKFPFCCCYWKPPNSALRKSAILGSQQFTANPNYYTTSPELALKLKSLLHLEISGEKLVFLDIIGEGCFGKVFKGLFQKSENEICEVAVKILKENSSNENQVDFLREVEIMSSFNHPNILAILGVVVIETGGSTPWMIFEYMEFGDLAELLRANSPHQWGVSQTSCKITKDDLHWLAAQVAHGMEYLSSQHFVHRDLATRNCLVGHDLVVKISDFGMSRDIYTCDYYKIGGSRMLPIRWMAPESVMYGKFTLESDVWSYGVVLWEIFAYGKQPYYGHTNEEVVKLIRRRTLLQSPEDCPRYAFTLMERCWTSNPYDRIKFLQVIDYLRQNCDASRGIAASITPSRSTSEQERTGTMPGVVTGATNAHRELLRHNNNSTAADHQNYLVPRRSSANAN